MGKCLKGKAESEETPGSYRCEKCGGVSQRKDHVCKPKKIRDKDRTGNASGKKGKKK